MRKRRKVHTYFFIAALILQFFAVLMKVFDPPTLLEFTLYDSIYEIDEFLLMEYLSIFYFLLGLGYWLLRIMKRRPNRSLTIVHFFITMGSIGLYAAVVVVSGFFEDDSYTRHYKHNETLIMLLLPILAVAQLLYVLNLFIGVANPYRKHTHRNREY